jgi:hypothetical protein
MGLGLNSGLCNRKAWVLPLEPHFQSHKMVFTSGWDREELRGTASLAQDFMFE